MHVASSVKQSENEQNIDVIFPYSFLRGPAYALVAYSRVDSVPNGMLPNLHTMLP